jgi:putative addiction module component (TIGR02574 family)
MGKEIKSEDILGLPAEDRLRLVEEIWDSLVADPASLPSPDWHRSELDRRVARHQVYPDQVEPWDEVRKRLRKPPAKRRRS